MTFSKNYFYLKYYEMNKFVLIFLFVILGCNSYDGISNKNHTKNVDSVIILNETSKKDFIKWYYKDINSDSIPGISLEKAYATILNNKKGNPVIVAFLDSAMDINNKSLSNNIWINSNEISNNNIDDDSNGYIDDINGWNFLGNYKGENIIHANYEYIRIVRFYNPFFENKTEENLNYEDLTNFNNYKKAKIKYDKATDLGRRKYFYAKDILKKDNEAKDALSSYFIDKEYNIDELIKIDTIGNGLKRHVDQLKSLLEYNQPEEETKQEFNEIEIDYTKRLNIEYNERELIGDNPNDINDTNYGNNNISSNLDFYTHGTRVSSIVTENVNENISINNIKIMPICISPFGDEHDKDIAIGISYAVDNGAKIINMSFGKEFSMYPEWVHNAFKYAEKHNVLIVSSCGNSGINLNEVNDYFPNDNFDNGKEVTDNFLLVGASKKTVNKDLKASYSNYGNIDVDIFAPGYEIFTSYPNNETKLDGGTSLSSALTSKVAALIFSYYPNLTASQVKHIIMDSGVKYTIPVNTPTKDDKNKMTPFNELSKSGKIVNAYNALIMADSISKVKKKKRK